MRWIVGLTLYLVMVVGFVTDVRFDFGGIGLFTAWTLLLGVVALAALCLRRWSVVRRLGAVLFFTVLGATIGHFVGDWQRRAAISKAKPLISAIDKFRTDNNFYPVSIGALVPRYLSAVPRPWTGFRLNEFRLTTGVDSFRISFELPEWKFCSYDSSIGNWQIDD